MARKDQITGRGKRTGNKVSKSNIKTGRTFNLNLQTKRMVNPATGRMMKVRLSARSLKTLNKWIKEGKKFDLNDLIKNN